MGVGPWVSGLEVARIEDDLYRWYTGHRLYHTGWTIDGESLGHPRGGDMRSLWLHSGYIGSRVSVDLSWEHVRRVQVADLLNDQVFVLLNPETRDVLSLRASWWAAPIGNLGLQLAGGPVQHHNFVPNANRFESHFSITWSSQGTGPGLFGRR